MPILQPTAHQKGKDLDEDHFNTKRLFIAFPSSINKRRKIPQCERN